MQREKWKSGLMRRTKAPPNVDFIDVRSESSYEFRRDLRTTIENAPDGKRFVVAFRDGRLIRVSEFPTPAADIESGTGELSRIAISEFLKHGKFVLPGLGRLVRVERKARIRRDSVTGKTTRIPASRVVRFELEKAMKDALLAPASQPKRPKR